MGVCVRVCSSEGRRRGGLIDWRRRGYRIGGKIEIEIEVEEEETSISVFANLVSITL